LKDNKRSEYPSEFIFFDTETTTKPINDRDLEHLLRLGYALYWRRRQDRRQDTLEWCYFTTREQFWDFVEHHCLPRIRILVISHNLPFDMGVVKGFAELDKRGFIPSKMIYEPRRNIWHFRKNTTSLLFLDNLNYFSTSLEKLGESVGLPKLPQPPFSASDEEWKVYCQRDVEILYYTWQCWLNFLSEFDLGSFGYTLASQALNAFRHRFMKYDVYIHNSKKAIELERESYRGGRVECFYLGELPKKDYYLLDVNSMYASMLKSYSYPCNLISTGKSCSIDFIKTLLTEKSVIAQVEVDTPEPCFGIKYKNKLIFPIGKFMATLNTPELKYGIDKGYITKVRAFAVYDHAPLFNDYVDFFYSKRVEFKEQGNEVYQYLCKLILNSLYGKFGQQIEEWKPIGYDETRIYDYWTEWDVHTKTLHTFRCLNHMVEEKIGSSEGFNSLVALPAEATAYARMYLWQLMVAAGREHVFYCDTDSLIVDKFGLDNLKSFINPLVLGQLKIEDKARKLIIYGLKDYRFGSKVVIKGIPKEAKKVEGDIYQTYQSLGIRTGLRQGELNRVIWRRIDKHLNRSYYKGVRLSDGIVKPLIMIISLGRNWRDFERMVNEYGELATVEGRYLADIMKPAKYNVPLATDTMDDYRPEDRIQAKIEDLELRRQGAMIYQRKKY
jgi:hypothetical protein